MSTPRSTSNAPTPGQAAAALVACAAGGATWVVGPHTPGWALVAAGVAWVVLLIGEWLAGEPPDEAPTMRIREDELFAEFPLQPLVGELGLAVAGFAALMAALLGIPWAAERVGIEVRPSVTWLAVLGSPVAMLGVAAALYLASARSIQLEIRQGVLELSRPLRRRKRFHLRELASVRAEVGALVVVHATGEERVRIAHLSSEQLTPFAADLDRFAREGGADPDVQQARREATRALAGALPPELSRGSDPEAP